jgi:ATP-dependent Clp protease ATP-binding subunit ClpB
VFTTNLGIVVPGPDGAPNNNVTMADSAETIDIKVRGYIEVFFREHLGRPELYNRLREGVVVFDFLRPDSLDQIAESSISRALEVASTRVGTPIGMSAEAREVIRAAATADSTNGGRGVVSAIETILINPLSRALFLTPATQAVSLEITHAKKLGQNWELEVR